MAILDLKSHTPTQNEKYFFDCNILMYIFYVNGTYAADLVSEYSNFFKKIVEAKGTIYVTEMLISEFTNTYIQCEFHRSAIVNKHPRDKSYFKNTFKLTEEYEDILKEIKIIIDRQLLPVATKVNTDFENFDLDSMYDNPTTFDFNDRYYGSEMAKLNAYIVTNDADFSDLEACNIITKNQKLLAHALKEN